MAPEALPVEMHRALIGHAIAQDATLSTPTQDTAHELKLGPLVGPITKELRSIMLKSCTAIGLPQIPEVDLQLQLYSVGDGKAAVVGQPIPRIRSLWSITASTSQRNLVAVV